MLWEEYQLLFILYLIQWILLAYVYVLSGKNNQHLYINIGIQTLYSIGFWYSLLGCVSCDVGGTSLYYLVLFIIILILHSLVHLFQIISFKINKKH